MRARLKQFRPDAILLEAEPKEQPEIDSLYALYRSGQLHLSALPTGRSERYQVGFALAKELNLPAPQGVDYYAATSQNLLATGDNIDAFKQGLLKLQTTSRPLKRLVQHDSLSVYDYIALANTPTMVSLIHRVQFNTPALVTNGAFFATGTNTNDLGKVDSAYVGAHYITLFYNRNLKIYSNILRAQQKTQARRVLVMLGLAHVGVQEELVAANPDYQVVHATKYLKTNQTKLLQPKQ
ncbi:hypothetical protein FHG12_17140 [Hymenobacter jejuensis]|uniref:Uncharacterized protein n=1 Tax=Hymenobacter jejuensis TaxID=2502781 RepID=A0A5B8A792_9BACT|nr:hypothetical protein FHG12_17140 [Hymenobacter jejuensis]